MPADYTENDLELLIDHAMKLAQDAGHPPIYVDKWRAGVGRNFRVDNERWPGHIASSAAGLRAGKGRSTKERLNADVH